MQEVLDWADRDPATLSAWQRRMLADYQTHLADTDGRSLPGADQRPALGSPREPGSNEPSAEQGEDDQSRQSQGRNLDEQVQHLREQGAEAVGLDETKVRRISNGQYAGQLVTVRGDLVDRIAADGKPQLAAEMQDKGVYVNLHGFPDFTPYARVLVELPPDLPVGADGVALRGDALREKDIAACDNLLKEMYKNDPELFAALQDSHTWHHLEGARHLILIPTEVHEAVRHYGGVATANSAGTGTVASPADSRGEPPAPAGSDAESEPPTPPSSVESLTRTPRPGEWSPSKLKDNHQQGDATYTGPIHGTPIAVPPDFVRTAGDTDGI
ncbi:hypothetical protein Athai_57080 [Actinocatenispora thailandica]|uniref:Uncharacterized protein n=1 Tax=Actinocatenispora thailandica TaxID=227318 RepID=A0A7R7DUQ8_9ACTN|nr:hypothetical protein Athai_57080 [Actinocatenispora thailandica]